MSDFDKWLDLFNYARKSKIPYGEYCLWGRECLEREHNGTHEGRHVFYFRQNGFSISTEISDYNNQENFGVEIEYHYGSEKPSVSYDFGYSASFLILTEGLNTNDLSDKFLKRLEKIDVNNLVRAMRNEFEYYLENKRQIDEETRRKEILIKELELARLKENV